MTATIARSGPFRKLELLKNMERVEGGLGSWVLEMGEVFDSIEYSVGTGGGKGLKESWVGKSATADCGLRMAESCALFEFGTRCRKN